MNTKQFLNKVGEGTKNEILKSIAGHYGISTKEAFEEITHEESEHLLDYLTEPQRSAVSVLMQKHGFR